MSKIGMARRSVVAQTQPATEMVKTAGQNDLALQKELDRFMKTVADSADGMVRVSAEARMALEMQTNLMQSQTTQIERMSAQIDMMRDASASAVSATREIETAATTQMTATSDAVIQATREVETIAASQMTAASQAVIQALKEAEASAIARINEASASMTEAKAAVIEATKVAEAGARNAYAARKTLEDQMAEATSLTQEMTAAAAEARKWAEVARAATAEAQQAKTGGISIRATGALRSLWHGSRRLLSAAVDRLEEMLEEQRMLDLVLWVLAGVGVPAIIIMLFLAWLTSSG